ncbi:tetratricopeptide repeat protein [Flectobacillus sp. BAB-3569]|uniref:tetratricopeptide repeat protein n=1 Tax=Flectobacillus sp. BAB-3569 TaxID=1509483 RepID=UPI001595D87F|nr:tetratricopeptide repeat protein [Flectobacillus sp. BAB-3569]
MRYLPNIIPEKSKVLPDYFKGSNYKRSKKNIFNNIIYWTLGVIFFIGSMIYIYHPLLSFIFAFIGVVLIPSGHDFLEKVLRFRLTTKIKSILSIVLFVSSLPLSRHYANLDKKLEYEEKLANDIAVKKQAILFRKEQQRKDSLFYFINLSNRFVEKNNLEKADQQLEKVMKFASSASDSEQINTLKKDIIYLKTYDLVRVGKFQTAILNLNSLLDSDPENPKLIYNLAICYVKTGRIQEAVEDLAPLVKSGDSKANKLYNKINPPKKRVSYYITRCWDGTSSNATGRGACSHHGGVKNWNEPVYEEYRKYE